MDYNNDSFEINVGQFKETSESFTGELVENLINDHRTKVPMDHKPNSVIADHIANNQIVKEHLVDGAVTSEKIGAGQVKAANIGELQVNNSHLANCAVGTANIKKDAVTSEKIGPGEVKSGNIGDKAVTPGKLSDNAVTTANIENGKVTGIKLADDAVTPAPGTVVIAARNSNRKFVRGADFVCNSADHPNYSPSNGDESEIMEAVKKLAATGGEILLLEGTYLFKRSAEIKEANISIRGSGKNTVIRFDDGTQAGSGNTSGQRSDTWLTAFSVGASANNFSISNLRMEYVSTAVSVTGTSKDNKISGILIDNLTIDCVRNGISLVNCADSRIQNCDISSQKDDPANKIIWLKNTKGISIHNNSLVNNGRAGGELKGIFGEDENENVTIYGNTKIESHDYAIKGNFSNSIIVGNVINNKGVEFKRHRLDSDGEGIIVGENNIIMGNVVDDVAEYSISHDNTIVVGAYNSLNKYVADFECKGSNDDVTIQAAIDALPDTGGNVLLLEGKYNLNKSIAIKKHNVSMSGFGNATVIRDNTNYNINRGCFDLNASNFSLSNLKIENMAYAVNKTTDGKLSNVKISNVYIDYTKYAISAENISDLFLSGCVINQIRGDDYSWQTLSSYPAVSITRGTNIDVSGCDIYAIYSDAVRMLNVTNVTIKNNHNLISENEYALNITENKFKNTKIIVQGNNNIESTNIDAVRAYMSESIFMGNSVTNWIDLDDGKPMWLPYYTMKACIFGEENIIIGNIINGNAIPDIARPSTAVVSAFDSKNKYWADFVCEGKRDEEKIQEAIDSLPKGGTVLLLEGTYNIFLSTGINLKANTTIMGLGNATHLRSNFAEQIMFNAAGDGISLRNFRATNVCAFLATGNAQNIKIDNLTVEGITNYGVAAGKGSVITNCLFKGGGGIFEGYPLGISINEGSVIQGNTFDSFVTAISIYGGGNIVSNNIIKNSTGIDASLDNNTFDCNIFENCQSGNPAGVIVSNEYKKLGLSLSPDSGIYYNAYDTGRGKTNNIIEVKPGPGSAKYRLKVDNNNGNLLLNVKNEALGETDEYVRGKNNTLMGIDSGGALGDGELNTGFGKGSLFKTSTGSANTALGANAGYSNETGSSNVFIGINSGYNNTKSGNTFIGKEAGRNNNGAGNIFIGESAGANQTGDNMLVIGNSAGTFIKGDMNNKTLSLYNHTIIEGVLGVNEDGVVYNGVTHDLVVGDKTLIFKNGILVEIQDTDSLPDSEIMRRLTIGSKTLVIKDGIIVAIQETNAQSTININDISDAGVTNNLVAGSRTLIIRDGIIADVQETDNPVNIDGSGVTYNGNLIIGSKTLIIENGAITAIQNTV